jgi:hypothetical protein
MWSKINHEVVDCYDLWSGVKVSGRGQEVSIARWLSETLGLPIERRDRRSPE